MIISSTGPWGIVPLGTRSCSTPMLRFPLSDFAAASVNTLGLSWHNYRLFKKMAGVTSKQGSNRIQMDLRHKNPKLCWKNPNLTHVASHSLTFVVFIVLCSLGTSRILRYMFTGDMNSANSELLPKPSWKWEIMWNKTQLLWRALLDGHGTKHVCPNVVSSHPDKFSYKPIHQLFCSLFPKNQDPFNLPIHLARE